MPRDDDVALAAETQPGELARAPHDDALVRVWRVGGTARHHADREAEHLADRGQSARHGTGTDHDQLRPRSGAGDRLTRREWADLHSYPSGLVPVVRALETNALAQSAHRVVLARLVEPVAAQAAEPRAALENPERHSFARGRASLEARHRHEGRALATFERFAHRGPGIHTLRIERGPVVMWTTRPPLVPDRTLLGQEVPQPGVSEVNGERCRRHPQRETDLFGFSARDL